MCLYAPLPVRFSVMSYNILCDKYATRQVYGYCPTWSLSWDYRKEHILKEIIDSLADVISLQVSTQGARCWPPRSRILSTKVGVSGTKVGVPDTKVGVSGTKVGVPRYGSEVSGAKV